ncbi:MAG: magnesium/cobalt transporter CorA [Gammaproteobacteria bacterium]|nr:magnesium/cobalt transporter CorA [Gammaproteobacteria bacterium]
MKLRRHSTRSRRRAPPGSSPGTLIADPAALGTSVSVIGYGPASIVEHAEIGIDDIASIRSSMPLLWVNVIGLADIELIERLGELFGLHDLALEDVVNVHQRPKTEAYEDHLFIVARMLEPGRGADSEQLSIFLGKDFVLTFQERPGDCFDLIRTRLRNPRNRIRLTGADYLAYALIDAVLDAYFPALEHYGEHLEQLEDAVVAQPSPALIERIHGMKRDLLALRRSVWPHREMVNALIREESEFVQEQTRLYLRDCYDHAIQLMDIIETYREIATGLVDVYLSSMSARLNDIMKVLTIIATIFMPLSFIASLYGMNFDRSVSIWNMPELGWRYGYLYALGIMLISALLLLAFFIRQRWLTPYASSRPPTREQRPRQPD